MMPDDNLTQVHSIFTLSTVDISEALERLENGYKAYFSTSEKQFSELPPCSRSGKQVRRIGIYQM